MSLPAGTRVRVVGGPWPQRVGCVGTVVEQPNGPGVYPDAGRAEVEVIVLLDADPMGAWRGSGWTCVFDRDELERLDGEDLP